MRIFKHPVKKLTLAAAFGGGYVLGARAGRERYEQIMQQARRVTDDPRVQRATERAEALVQDSMAKMEPDPARAGEVEPARPGVHRLLADEHVVVPDEVVYSSGPDVVQPLVDDQRDRL